MDLEKCSIQSVLTVDKQLRFRSNLPKEEQYIVETALKKEEHKDNK